MSPFSERKTMPRKNPERSVVLPQEMAEALDSYSAKKRITTSQAIRQFIEKGLSITCVKGARKSA